MRILLLVLPMIISWRTTLNDIGLVGRGMLCLHIRNVGEKGRLSVRMVNIDLSKDGLLDVVNCKVFGFCDMDESQVKTLKVIRKLSQHKHGPKRFWEIHPSLCCTLIVGEHCVKVFRSMRRVDAVVKDCV